MRCRDCDCAKRGYFKSIPAMKAVFRVVYSKDEDIVGVERTFPFNYDVIAPEDDELKSILRELSI